MVAAPQPRRTAAALERCAWRDEPRRPAHDLAAGARTLRCAGQNAADRATRADGTVAGVRPIEPLAIRARAARSGLCGAAQASAGSAVAIAYDSSGLLLPRSALT